MADLQTYAGWLIKNPVSGAYQIGPLKAFLFRQPIMPGGEFLQIEFALIVVDGHGDQSPMLLITCEKTGSKMREVSSTSAAPFLCVNDNTTRINLGNDDRYADTTFFLAAAESIIKDRWKIFGSLQSVSRTNTPPAPKVRNAVKSISIEGKAVNITPARIVASCIIMMTAMLIYPPVRTYHGYEYMFITDIGQGEDLNIALLLLQWFVVIVMAFAALWWVKQQDE